MTAKAQFRPCRRGHGPRGSRQLIRACAGSHFDPLVAESVLECDVDFETVASRFADR